MRIRDQFAPLGNFNPNSHYCRGSMHIITQWKWSFVYPLRLHACSSNEQLVYGKTAHQYWKNGVCFDTSLEFFRVLFVWLQHETRCFLLVDYLSWRGQNNNMLEMGQDSVCIGINDCRFDENNNYVFDMNRSSVVFKA